MPYVSADAIQQARDMDLLTYLQNYEPGELVHVSGNTYCTREHDSLKISNGKWCWFSRSIGGKSALDYLMKVKNYSLPEAVEAIAGHGAVQPSISYKPKQDRHRDLLMPELMERPSQAAAYLRSRGIHPKVIEYCIENNLLFETVKYHNAVFVGYGNDGKAKYAAMRGTLGNYKGEVTGSDKHYSFKIDGDSQSCNVHLFEAAIDLLSFASLKEMQGYEWNKEHLVSLAGVFQTKRAGVVPIALERFLADNPNITTIHLHLDNDEVGRSAAEGIILGLSDKYTVLDEPPAYGKDVNEMLQIIMKERRKEEPER